MEQNMSAMPTMENSKQQGNGLKIATAIASVIAVCGIGFGIYGMIQSSQKDNQISNLKVQIKNSDGTTTTIETDKIEVKDDSETIVITDTFFPSLSFTENNFIGDTEYTITTEDDTQAFQKSFSVFTEYGDQYTLYANGKVTATIRQQNRYEEKDITSNLPGRAVDMVAGQWGNGGTYWIIFILEDGTVVTMWELSQDETGKVYPITGATDIVKVYGSRSPYGPLGYAQDKNGKIHDIIIDNSVTYSFKLAS